MGPVPLQVPGAPVTGGVTLMLRYLPSGGLVHSLDGEMTGATV